MGELIERLSDDVDEVVVEASGALRWVMLRRRTALSHCRTVAPVALVGRDGLPSMWTLLHVGRG